MTNWNALYEETKEEEELYEQLDDEDKIQLDENIKKKVKVGWLPFT